MRQIIIFSSNETERYPGVRRILPSLCTHLLRAMPATHCQRRLAASLHSAFYILKCNKLPPDGISHPGVVYPGIYTFRSTGPLMPGTLPLSEYCHISTRQG